MTDTVGDVLLSRLREWDVERVFGYAGDGINGLLAAWGRAGNQPAFIQARHEEMAAFEAVGYAKFSGQVGVCAATSGPGAIHLLNGLYDALLDHVPVVAIVGQTSRSALGGSYQQEVDLGTLFKDVCHHYVATVMVPEQLPNVIDRAIRIATAQRAPTAIIIPSDVQELAYDPPGHAFKMVPSSLGWVQPRIGPDEEAHPPGGRYPQCRRAGGHPGRPGGPVRPAAGDGRRRAARGRRGQGAARQGRACRRPALRDGLHRAAGYPAVVRTDDGVRHPADRRLELSVHPVHARVRAGPGGADRPGRRHDRHAISLRGQRGGRLGGGVDGVAAIAGPQEPTGAGGTRSRPTWPAGGRPWNARPCSTATGPGW